MPKIKRGKRKPVRRVKSGGYSKRPVIEREREEPEMRRVPRGPQRRGEQTNPTQPNPAEGPADPSEGPGDDRGSVVFKSYTTLDTTKLPNVKIPVDPCGAASE